MFIAYTCVIPSAQFRMIKKFKDFDTPADLVELYDVRTIDISSIGNTLSNISSYVVGLKVRGILMTYPEFVKDSSWGGVTLFNGNHQLSIDGVTHDTIIVTFISN